MRDLEEAALVACRHPNGGGGELLDLVNHLEQGHEWCGDGTWRTDFASARSAHEHLHEGCCAEPDHSHRSNIVPRQVLRARPAIRPGE